MRFTLDQCVSTEELVAKYGTEEKKDLPYAPGTILCSRHDHSGMDWAHPEGKFKKGDPVFVKIDGGKAFQKGMLGNSVFVTCLQDGEYFKLSTSRWVIVGYEGPTEQEAE